MSKLKIKLLRFCIGLLLLTSIHLTMQASTNKYNIIPYPQKLIPQEGNFVFNSKTTVICNGDSSIQKIARQFCKHFELVTGLKLKLKINQHKFPNNALLFETAKPQATSNEAYDMQICTRNIVIRTNSANGAFYALQSLYQLMPPEIYASAKTTQHTWSVPCVNINDSPRFAYRGLHLDVCRHFFPIEFIKKYIDAMAIHKFNTFHWHLTDDQGWRIEIKKYPLLTEVGSKRAETMKGYYFDNYPQEYDNTPYGGYYTQDQAKEIVAYAKARFITVIPEIELPGHAQAAIAAYPFLSCRQDKNTKPATSWGVFNEVYCPREKTFDFLEDVLTEVMNIFPGKYIHIGGDECPKDNWKKCTDCQALIKKLKLKNEDELQSYFVERIEKFVNSKGRQIIGWDEILDGGLAPNATVMSWRGTQGGIAAAKSGHDVIMTPGSHCYFDQYQTNPVNEPTTIGGLLPLKKVYEYEPVPSELNSEEAAHILGAQANMWSEYLVDSRRVEYMAFPRISAMSEVVWSNKDNRDWESFRHRMIGEFDRFSNSDIQACRTYFDVQFHSFINKNKQLEITLECDRPEVEIRYNTEGHTPTMQDSIYTKPFILQTSETVTAAAFVNGKMIGKSTSDSYIVSKLTGLGYSKSVASSWYDGGGNNALTDGKPGNAKVTSQWVGLGKGIDCEIIFDCNEGKNPITIHKFALGMLHAVALGVDAATNIKLFGSQDGTAYKLIGETTVKPVKTTYWSVIRPQMEFQPVEVRYIKVVIGKTPDSPLDSPTKGGGSHLFVDEISVW